MAAAVMIKFASKLKAVWTSWLKEESSVLFRLSWPVALTLFLHNIIPLISLVMIGHVDKQKSKLLIDATSLGVTFINVAGYGIIYGFGTATDTLSSQAYGAGNYKRVGIILQRSILICSFALFPVITVFLNAESILLILHQSPCVARLTGKYCKIISVALPALYLEVVVVKYLQSQAVVKPTIVTGLLTNITNAVCLALLLYVAGLEIEGAAITTVIGLFVLLFSIMLYMFMRKPVNKTWQGFSWKALEDWKEFLCLGIPGMVVFCAEWLAFEIGSFVCGSVDGVQLAAFTITLNLIALFFIIPYGIGIAAGIRVGNMLGAGEPGKAKKVSIIAAFFATLWCFLEMVLFLSYQNIGELFTSDREVIDTIGNLTYLLAVFVYSDGIQAVLTGVLRGCGKQLVVAVTDISSYYLLGLPVGIALVYAADMGALGYWIGCTVGSLSQLIAVFILLFRINFKEESKKAQIKAGLKVDGLTEMILLDKDKSESTRKDATNDDDDVVLVREETSSSSDEDENKENGTSKISPIKLLLIRTPWYIIGLVVLVTGVVLSQYRIHLPYEAECDDIYNDNFTNSTTPTYFTNYTISY